MLSEERQLGRYRLLKLIATGGMGAIHLAEDASINRQVAIKVIRSEITLSTGEGGSSNAARLFEREAKAVAMLDHPHILPLYDYGEEKQDGTVLTYLVMPYRPEGSLATWLEQRGAQNPLALEDVESIITQTASALQYTHEHQIIHQDVKPSNFLIRPNKENPNRPDIQISDFGIARLSNMTSGASQSIRGTPSYMAPEQWEGHPQPASDQYALAVMAYELITGHLPFKGNPMQMMFAHVNTPPQAPSSLIPGLPPALDTVILRGLAKRPADRFPTIAAFAQAFQQAARSSASAQVQLANPYATSTGISTDTPNTPARSSNLFTTLAISETEATRGSRREITLPDGTRLPVSIPSGAHNGQVIELNNTSGTGPQMVHLKLSVRFVSQAGTTPPAPLPTNDALTYIAGSANGNAQSPLARNTPTYSNGPTSGVAQSPSTHTNNPIAPAYWQGGATPSSPITGQTSPATSSQTNSQYPAPGMLSYAGAPRKQTVGPLPLSTPDIPPRPQKRTSRSLLIASLAALCLILGGAVLVYAVRSGLGGAGGGTPSATASSSTNFAPTQTTAANGSQNVQGTADAQASATASAGATADAQGTADAQASATAQNQANATATAYAGSPYGGTLALNDPLVDNSQGHNWNTTSNPSVGSSCQFTNGAYHMVMPGNYGGPCVGEATSFSNFAFQVQMTFLKYGQHFSGGGLIFRDTAGSQYYVLEIYASGQYIFYSCDGNNCSHGIAGYPSSSLVPSFHRGLNQTNTIAVVAQGGTFTFYANGQQFAGPINDGTYSSGMIGFFAEGGSEGGAGATTDVAYSNIRVWQL